MADNPTGTSTHHTSPHPVIHPRTARLDPFLLEVLACPDEHHSPLLAGEPGRPDAAALHCPECGRIYDIRDGIPVLLLDDARYPTDRIDDAVDDAVDDSADPDPDPGRSAG